MDLIACYISTEDLCLHYVSFVLKGSGDSTQCHLAGEGHIQIVHLQEDSTFALPVQGRRDSPSGAFHAVMNEHSAASHRHTVTGSALRIVVVVILLVCRYGKLIAAFVIENRVPERVGYVLAAVGTGHRRV